MQTKTKTAPVAILLPEQQLADGADYAGARLFSIVDDRGDRLIVRDPLSGDTMALSDAERAEGLEMDARAQAITERYARTVADDAMSGALRALRSK